MNNKPDSCNAITVTGKPCTKKANESGYCKAHEQKILKDKKNKQYFDIVNAILDVCAKKGWGAGLDVEDFDRQLIDVNIYKQFDMKNVTGIIHATIDKDVQYRIENTSFYSYGQKDLLEAIDLKLSELPWLGSKKGKRGKTDEATVSQLIVRVLKNFDRSARQLKRRYANRDPYRIKDEYDVQDLLHAVLRAYFDDVRPEEYTPSYAGSSSRVDFLLKPEKSVIEVKYATEKLKDKQLGEQLIIDIKKYQAHPDCSSLYCLVYDPEGNVRNPIGFEKDLSGKHNNIYAHAFVVPH